MIVTVRKDQLSNGVVTTATLLSELSAIRIDVASMLTKVEVVSIQYAGMQATVADHETRLRQVFSEIPADLPKRLSLVEKWQWRVSAVVGFAALVAGMASGWVGSLVFHTH